MYSARYSCQIVMKLRLYLLIFEKYSNIKFHENIRPVEAMVHADRHTDEHRHTNRRDEANIRFHAILRKRSRNCVGADVCGQIPPSPPGK
jgi:hypothetical protein